MTQAKREHPPVGIDLGTTFSVVATLDAQGRPVTLQNAEGDTTTPSVVMFDRKHVIVGKEAVKLASYEPDALAAYAKRDIGAARYGKAIRGHHVPPEVVQSFVLRKLKADAELKLGPIRRAVVTVPAYFNETRRKATQDAACLADLELLDIINEPTAAALAYGVERGLLDREGAAVSSETILVYDLGGGTFDMTLMELQGHDYRALATAGDVYLGGIDWDRRIVDYVAEQFMAEHGGLDPRQQDAARVRLMREAEEAKRALTARDDVIITLEHEGRLLRCSLERAHFEQLTLDLVERTRFTARKLLRDVGRTWKDVTRLLLVGGSSRMPMIQQMLEAESGLKPDRSLAADEAVAHGAAVYANFLLAGKPGAVRSEIVGHITNVNSHDLGVLAIEPATKRPRRKILIPRNTPLPARRSSVFVTQKKNQISVDINVVEGGDDSGHNATPVGLCRVIDLPRGLPAKSPVHIEFQYAENGRLAVHARLPDADCEATMEIRREANFSDDDLRIWRERIAAGDLLVDSAVADDDGSDDDAVYQLTPDQLLEDCADDVARVTPLTEEDIVGYQPPDKADLLSVEDVHSTKAPRTDTAPADEAPAEREQDDDLGRFLAGLP